MLVHQHVDGDKEIELNGGKKWKLVLWAVIMVKKKKRKKIKPGQMT